MHDYTFSTHKLPEHIDYGARGDVHIWENKYKFNERHHTGSGYLNGS